MTSAYASYHSLTEIIGELVRIRVPLPEQGESPMIRLDDLAVLMSDHQGPRLAQVIEIHCNIVTVQVLDSTKGLSTQTSVRFLGYPMQVVSSRAVLGRVLDGKGEPLDKGPSLQFEPRIDIGGPSVNPMCRVLASKMIRTDVPMIDVFNCLVESQKIPIFSVSGEPYNALLARIGIQADADMIVFG
ncbi:MAG: V-type ATP synthase subunit B, partial [Gammaproteobacteria bacterium]